MSSKKLLLGCYEIPGYGGANTATYQLFHLMQEDGYDVHYVNLVDEQDGPYFEYAFGPNYGNPRCLSHVYNSLLKGPLYSPHPELSDLIASIGPDVMIGVDFIAALLMKRARPETKTIFMTAGCQQVKDAVNGRLVTDLITQEKKIQQATGTPRKSCRQEIEAVDNADLILTHSNITLALFQHFYSYLGGKIYPKPIWFGEWIYREALNYRAFAKPFGARDIDVLFLASSWARPEKNYPWVTRALAKLPQANIHIVGEIAECDRLQRGHYYGLVTDREEVFKLMGRAKTVACPSSYDSAPGILFEAAAMGCNIVATKNCGNWMVCHDQLLADPFTEREFLRAIALSQSQKFADNMQFFLQAGCYRQLVEITQLI